MGSFVEARGVDVDGLILQHRLAAQNRAKARNNLEVWCGGWCQAIHTEAAAQAGNLERPRALILLGHADGVESNLELRQFAWIQAETRLLLMNRSLFGESTKFEHQFGSIRNSVSVHNNRLSRCGFFG